MTRAIAFLAAFALSLASSACNRADTLSVQDNPAGTARLSHVLLDPLTQAICVTTAPSQTCTEHTADVLVTGFSQIDDVQPEWIDNRAVRVNAASGTVREAGRSRDGSTRMEVHRL